MVKRAQVRLKYPSAQAEYRLSMPRPGFAQLSYWAIVDRSQGTAKLLGRAETEVAAWQVAADAILFEGLLVTIDQKANAVD